MTWSARLRGDNYDLARFADMFATGATTVAIEPAGSYALRSDTFDELTTAHEVESVAQALLVRLNGAARMSDPTMVPVVVDGYIVVARGWATKADIDTFEPSANRPDVSGDLARHARLLGSRPKASMGVERARVVVLGVVEAWLDAKVAGTA